MKNKNLFLVKFTVAAVMLGFLSPSVHLKKDVQTNNDYSNSVMPMQLSISFLNTAEAKRSRGGGAHRGGGKRNVKRNVNRNKNVSRNRNVNKNVNRNVNKNVNVNVNHSNRYYGGHSRGYYGYYRGAPLMAFTTGLVIGSVIAASTMPTTCSTVVVNGISYRRCDNAYYQPFYEGDTLVYKVVASPY